jgi:hypothetical protein
MLIVEALACGEQAGADGLMNRNGKWHPASVIEKQEVKSVWSASSGVRRNQKEIIPCCDHHHLTELKLLTFESC